MQAEVNGKVIQLSEAGWLENLDEWSEDLAVKLPRTKRYRSSPRSTGISSTPRASTSRIMAWFANHAHFPKS